MLANLETAPIGEPLRATLSFLRKLTRSHGAITPGDVSHLFDQGVSRAQLEDALSVCFAFNVIDRLADTFHFHVGDEKSFEIGAKMLLRRGYK